MSAGVVHKLWVAPAVAAVVICLVLTVRAVRQERAAARRAARLLAAEAPARPRPRRRGLPGAPGRDWWPVLAVAGACWALVGGTAGCAVALVAAVGIRTWLRRPRPAARARTAQARTEAADATDVPLAADLLAACIAAGAAPVEAAEAVGESLGGPVGERLARIAAELRLGGEPEEAWARLAEIPQARELARCLARAGTSGAPAARSVARLAVGLRAERARTATAKARTAAVLITAPVGLCFLPAFLALGVAPVVIGLAGALLGG
ncbi:type II secretion system F family protein [Streptomyces sp. GC420]|uniref:type II secretion system F family protein n=1 Tax=Streptomyces sp. GC420 TaxID=2697568 RepID=UPI001414FA0D|nr:type II secretion system F family protein [Streptomyces sp. GC420]NBM16568.1 type II secretion protein F [Streptomyces sp. GC420]